MVLSFEMLIRTFEELRERTKGLGPRRVVLVSADDEVALTAVAEALRLGIAIPVLAGDLRKIHEIAEALGLSGLIELAEFVDAPNDAAGAAVRLVRAGGAEILLKGHLRTDELLRAVLDKQDGLRTGRLLSDVMLFEYGNGERRLVGLTDGGLNVAPTLEQKIQIVENAIEVMRSLGIARPRIAIMSATEVVSDAVPSTGDAQALTAMAAEGAFGDAEVYGPLAVDNALLESAAAAKGIRNPVAGRADCLVAPNIEAANMFGKAAKYLGGSACAHVVVGAKAPILIPSRVESAEDKLNAIALGVIFAAR
jgi:phosphate butyryltransferase